MRHFYLRNSKGNIVATVVTELDKGENLVFYGISIHNPVDKFNKQLGIDIAKGRMEKGSWGYSGTVELAPVKGVTRKNVLFDIQCNEFLPEKVRKAAYRLMIAVPKHEVFPAMPEPSSCEDCSDCDCQTF